MSCFSYYHWKWTTIWSQLLSHKSNAFVTFPGKTGADKSHFVSRKHLTVELVPTSAAIPNRTGTDFRLLTSGDYMGPALL